MSFKDHFSTQAKTYSQYRPSYPEALFEDLAAMTLKHNLAWDCACGNGQASVALADYFDKVIATDASAKQIDNALNHPKVTYKVASAEQVAIADHSVDLITVAQALHWFDFDKFFAEAKRVLTKDGVIAAWVYPLMVFSNNALQELFLNFANVSVGPYWPKERKYCDSRYEDIPFPFAKVTTKNYFIPYQWTRDQFIGYLNTWSSTNRYIKEHQQNPIDVLLLDELNKIWPEANSKEDVTFEIIMKVARV